MTLRYRKIYPNPRHIISDSLALSVGDDGFFDLLYVVRCTLSKTNVNYKRLDDFVSISIQIIHSIHEWNR